MKKIVEVTMRLHMEFDADSMKWLENLADKAREYCEIKLMRVDGLPSTFLIEGSEDGTN